MKKIEKVVNRKIPVKTAEGFEASAPEKKAEARPVPVRVKPDRKPYLNNRNRRSSGR